jgi:hypothetical protein
MIIGHFCLVPPPQLDARIDNPLSYVKVQIEFRYHYHFVGMATASGVALLIRKWDSRVGARPVHIPCSEFRVRHNPILICALANFKPQHWRKRILTEGIKVSLLTFFWDHIKTTSSLGAITGYNTLSSPLLFFGVNIQTVRPFRKLSSVTISSHCALESTLKL